MAISFTYVKDAYLFSKKTYIFPGLLESSTQSVDLAPLWTIQLGDRESTLCQGKSGPPLATALVDRSLIQFTWQGRVTSGGADSLKSTWAIVDFDGNRYDWVAGMMQYCWKLENADGRQIAQFIGMSQDYKIRGTLVLHAKISESLISLLHLSIRHLK